MVMVSSLYFFFFFFIIIMLCLGACFALNSDVLLLLQIKPILSGDGDGDGDGDGNPSLSTWTLHTPLCTWAGITWSFSNGTLLNCTMPNNNNNNTSLSNDPSIQAYSIALTSARLSGSLPRALSRLPALRSLDLSNNSLSGGIPASLLAQTLGPIQSLRLSSNQLSGAIPASVWDLCPHLRDLRLDHNSFSSEIPAPVAAAARSPCASLRTLDLSSNLLSGPVPSFLGEFANLTQLDLSNNRLRGAIPRSLGSLAGLIELNLANNNLSGRIPTMHGPVGSSLAPYEGNPLLCGPPSPVLCGPQGNGHVAMDKKVLAALVIGALAVSVVALAICAALAHRLNWGRGDAGTTPGLSPSSKTKKKKMTMITRDLILDGGGGDDTDGIGDGKLVRFEGGEHLGVDDVLNAPGEVLGKTSYGTVYKAKLGGGASMIALRLLREDTVKEKDEFMLGIRHLGQIRNPNVVSLLAYYAGPKGEKLLVYNYLSRGSLFDLLYNRSTSRSPLSWTRRHKIALGAARGLVHLHHGLPSQIIHGNVKSKNIVVDESFQGQLADYGLPLLMTSEAQSEMLKTAAKQGYRAPELVKMSRANPKTDVYNFGIVLLELLTGKPPLEFDDSENVVVDLPTYVKQVVLEERVSEIFDSEIVSSMHGSPIDDGLVQTLQLAMGCCAPLASTRPDIKEVVRQLEDVHPKVLNPLYTPIGMKSPQNFPL